VVAGRRAGVYRRGCNGRDLLTDRLSQGSFKGNPIPNKRKGGRLCVGRTGSLLGRQPVECHQLIFAELSFDSDMAGLFQEL
jgi:hypothetical protein